MTSPFFDRYWATNALAASILAAEGADLWPWWVVERWLRANPVGVREMQRPAIDHLRLVCVARIGGETEIDLLERDGLRIVPSYLSERIAPHAPRLTGQVVPRLGIDCAGDCDE
jgi:hypothetical protein